MQDNRQQIAEQAADWFVMLREQTPSARDREAFSAWLLDSPIHVHEYLAIAQLYGNLANIDPDNEIDIESLLPAKTENSNVLSLKDSTAINANEDIQVTDKRSHVTYAVAAIIAVIITAFASVILINQDWQQQHIVTAVGEQRSIALDDGSIIEINTQSKLTVQMDKETRVVRLINGEAYFDVETDHNRPFIVDTGDAHVKVLGTKFNIYKQAGNTVVTVLDGKVTVIPKYNLSQDILALDTNKEDFNRPVELAVGEQVQIGPQRVPIEKVSVNVRKVTAWQDRRLIFEGQTLKEIVDEFNRYNSNQIEVIDSELAGLELSGAFESNDPDSLIEFLKRNNSIKVIVRPKGLRVITLGDVTTL